ncbi:uncharacterized protein EI90DRAFT_3017396 [Cantharellus anzutake]|uniref:uncharacterized protein n=1 Tax=Cantharellus anzutake TaxID=1750568 RepID=UPI001905F053|nr:uncharacterized protein EI90DRAFT_3017396 [Cantharellus anzutake]KAF8329160.1 hypothetical protein EI90DRAFT_3017396 [Cantharellus anzutake]
MMHLTKPSFPSVKISHFASTPSLDTGVIVPRSLGQPTNEGIGGQFKPILRYPSIISFSGDSQATGADGSDSEFDFPTTSEKSPPQRCLVFRDTARLFRGSRTRETHVEHHGAKHLNIQHVSPILVSISATTAPKSKFFLAHDHHLCGNPTPPQFKMGGTMKRFIRRATAKLWFRKRSARPTTPVPRSHHHSIHSPDGSRSSVGEPNTSSPRVDTTVDVQPKLSAPPSPLGSLLQALSTWSFEETSGSEFGGDRCGKVDNSSSPLFETAPSSPALPEIEIVDKSADKREEERGVLDASSSQDPVPRKGWETVIHDDGNINAERSLSDDPQNIPQIDNNPHPSLVLVPLAHVPSPASSPSSPSSPSAFSTTTRASTTSTNTTISTTSMPTRLLIPSVARPVPPTKPSNRVSIFRRFISSSAKKKKPSVVKAYPPPQPLDVKMHTNSSITQRLMHLDDDESKRLTEIAYL